MSELIHFEYAPPRSWEQFEELCADLFEAAWSDPTVVRHGRAGQRQHGVDIIASRGSAYPIGIQCKKKTIWPQTKLSLSDVEKEILEAEKFVPALKEFYILTTAVSDAHLQKQVRILNTARAAKSQFSVSILFWPEIVRKVASHPIVAKKHFPIAGSDGKFSPLLASWYTRDGKLDMTGDEWHLAVSELGENFFDWPTGHVIVRQHETDAYIAERQQKIMEDNTLEQRKGAIELRRQIRYMRKKEDSIQELIRAIYTNSLLNFYIHDLDESGIAAAKIIKAIIELSLAPPGEDLSYVKIRLKPPEDFQLSQKFPPKSLARDDFAIRVPQESFRELQQMEVDFPQQYYGNRMVPVVSELPRTIRDEIAIPQIIRRAWRIVCEEQIPLSALEAAGYLDLHSWQWHYRY